MVTNTYNRHETWYNYLWVELVLTIRGDWISRASKINQDSMRLGRWVFTLITSSMEKTMRIISIYRPTSG